MKVLFVASCALAALFCACAAPGGFPPETPSETMKVGPDKRIEISLAPETFAVAEVEFHVDASRIPPPILEKAKELMPNGYVNDCEIEYNGGNMYYEVTCSAGGKEQEVMLTPEGVPHRWEVEIARSDVPAAVLAAAEGAIQGAKIKKYESIRDGNNNPLEYHFKAERELVKYKVVVALDGTLVAKYRETIGEIEVPLN